MGEKRKGPSPSCLCGECRKCKKREYDRARAADPVIQARRIAQAQAWREANRYDSTPAWTRPLPIDRPFGAHLMDHGCYW